MIVNPHPRLSTLLFMGLNVRPRLAGLLLIAGDVRSGGLLAESDDSLFFEDDESHW